MRIPYFGSHAEHGGNRSAARADVDKGVGGTHWDALGARQATPAPLADSALAPDAPLQKVLPQEARDPETLAAVARAVETLLTTPTLDAKRAALESEQHRLLTDDAEHMLLALIALVQAQIQQPGDPRQKDISRLCELHLLLLRSCRDHHSIARGWEDFLRALNEATVQGSEVPVEQRGEQQVRFTLEETERGTQAADFLANKLGLAPDDPQFPRIQEQLRLRLAQVAAGDNATDDSDADDVGDFRRKLLAWLNKHPDRSQRRFLEEHLVLLDTRSDDMLIELIEQDDGKHDVQDVLRTHLLVLQDARARTLRLGNYIGAVREAYVNVYGGLALDVPTWLEETERQLEATQSAGRPDQTAAARAGLLRTALARTDGDGRIAPEVVAQLNSLLWKALDDNAGTNQNETQEEGITCLTRALASYTFVRYPRRYAATKNNLGNTYVQRIEGQRKANLETAITCYREALRVYRYEALPVQYATIQHNLGATYQDRIEGERRTNLEAAITCFNEALRVHTLETFPAEYRRTQLNRARAEATREHWAGAHAAYHGAVAAEDLLAALTGSSSGLDAVLREGGDAATRDGYALVRLGRAGDAAVAIERGRARGLAQALALDLADPQQITDPVRRTRYLTARERLRQAQAQLNQSLQVTLTPEATPSPGDPRVRATALEDARRALYLERIAAYSAAKAAFDVVVAEIHAARDPADFLDLTLDAPTILRATRRQGTGHTLVYLVATRWGGAAVAAFSAGASMGTKPYFAALDLPLLSDALVNDLIQRMDPADTADATDGRRRVLGGFGWAQEGHIFRHFLSDWEGTSLQARAAALHAACEAASARDSASSASSTSTLDHALQHVLALPCFASLAARPLDALSTTETKEVALLAATVAHAFLREELTRCLPALAEAALRPLAAWLGEHEVQRVMLVPCGMLAAFPLAATEVAPGRTFAETFPTSVVPNARALLRSSSRASHPDRNDQVHKERQTHTEANQSTGDHGSRTLGRAGVYAVGNPSGDLRWGEAEAITLVRLARALGLPSAARIQAQAQLAWLSEALSLGAVVDASCHGAFRPDDPLESSLHLAGDRRLTLRDAISHTVDLRGLRLLILSACQSAILDLRGARNEVCSLATGMYQAEAKAVLAPLWSVDDRATYLLMVRFAQLWLPHRDLMSPAEALRDAQLWLRTVTYAGLAQWEAELPLPAATTAGPVAQVAQAAAEQAPSGAVAASAVDLVVTAKLELGGATKGTGGVVAVQGLGERAYRYESAEAERLTRLQAGRQLDKSACPYADPIYWAGFQITGW